MEPLSFEESIEQLERIASQLDQGRLSLQNSLDRYEKGIHLIAHCRKILDEARLRISVLRGIDSNGEPVLEETDLVEFQTDRTTPGRRKMKSPTDS